MKHPLIVRRDAAQATRQRFFGCELNWGSDDCVHLIDFDLQQVGSGIPALEGLPYRTERGALKRLKGLGFDGLIPALDAIPTLRRIAPAMAVTADIIAFHTDSRLWDCALTMALDNGRVLGFGSDGSRQVCGVAEPNLALAVAAWSIA